MMKLKAVAISLFFSLIVFECSAMENLNPKSCAVQLQETQTKRDRWFRKDKLEHFLLSAFMTSFGYGVLREPFDKAENPSLAFGSGVAVGLGITKEIYDSRSKKGQSSFKDLIADIAGIGFVVSLIKLF